MIERDVTLKQLFALQPEQFASNARAALNVSLRTSSLREGLLKEAKHVRWDSISSAIIAEAEDLLDVKLVDVLCLAWKKYRLLAKYADPDRYSPDEIVLAPLVTHTVKSEHHPYIEILVRDRPIGKIVFDIELSLTLQGFVLKIQDAKIKAIETGSWQGRGAISLENEVLVEKAFDPVTLAGSIDLGEGISLRALAAVR